jgi:hypothetical protein
MSTGSGGLIENSELLAAGCKLEAVAPSDPVIPVADGLVGLIRLDRWRSIAKEGLPSCGVPTDLHKHVVLALILHGHL